MYGGEPSGEAYTDDEAASVSSSGGGRRHSGGSAGGSAHSYGDVSVLGALNGLFGYAEETLNELSENYTFEVRPEIRLKLRKRCAQQRRSGAAAAQRARACEACARLRAASCADACPSRRGAAHRG